MKNKKQIAQVSAEVQYTPPSPPQLPWKPDYSGTAFIGLPSVPSTPAPEHGFMMPPPNLQMGLPQREQQKKVVTMPNGQQYELYDYGSTPSANLIFRPDVWEALNKANVDLQNRGLLPKGASLIDRITSAYRDVEKQSGMYKNYLEGNAKYPVARPGTSWHNWGAAFDVPALFAKKIAPVMGNYGFRYLGSYDPVHFQYEPLSPLMSQLITLWKGRNVPGS